METANVNGFSSTTQMGRQSCFEKAKDTHIGFKGTRATVGLIPRRSQLALVCVHMHKNEHQTKWHWQVHYALR